MKKYSIYYSYKGIGDVIIVIFDNEKKATRHERKGRVEVIYHEDEIIGYNIFDIKDIIKIKSEGQIHLPSRALIEVINTMLTNAKVPTLDIHDHSGYWTAEVVDVNDEIATITLGKEMVHAIDKSHSLKKGDKVVIMKAGYRLSNGKIVCASTLNGQTIDAYICTNGDLGINENIDQILVIDNDEEIGKDFFYMGGN